MEKRQVEVFIWKFISRVTFLSNTSVLMLPDASLKPKSSEV